MKICRLGIQHASVSILWTTTARGIKIGLFYKLISDFYPDIKIAYISDSSVHIIWDEDNLFYPFKYYMDICYPSKSGEISYIDTHEFASIEEIYKWLDENLPFEISKTETLGELESQIQGKLDEKDCDEYYCELEEYDGLPPHLFRIYYDYEEGENL